MLTPRIEINLEKIAHNTKILKGLYSSKGIEIIGVTKVVCGNPTIANILVKSGINILADSRIENIQRGCSSTPTLNHTGLLKEAFWFTSRCVSSSEKISASAGVLK